MIQSVVIRSIGTNVAWKELVRGVLVCCSVLRRLDTTTSAGDTVDLGLVDLD